MPKRKTTEQFIQDAYCKHGDTYNYSLIDYKGAKTKVKIICSKHGVFEQQPSNHLGGQGCSKCADVLVANSSRMDLKTFIHKSRQFHQDRYDYSLVEYVNNYTKVKIICPVHAEFEQTPSSHLRSGCDKCSRSNKKTKTTEQFIQDAYCKHGDTYNYKLVNYIKSRIKVKIICPKHGVFEQQPSKHLRGGCSKCGVIKSNINGTKTTEQFIIDAWCKHGDTYNYSLIDYKKWDTKVKITCPVHGIFEQQPNSHIQGSSCPKCSHLISKQEIQLQDWLKGYVSIETNNREIIKPYELDTVIPDKKIAIEYNGLYWHSESRGKNSKYHLNKYNLCKDKGYRLIQIWENEWLFKQDIVKSIILNSIGINKRVIHGRKCRIQNVSVIDARIMYDDNHIQGFKGGVHKGLYFEDELVSLMSIDKRNELQRFVNLKYTKVHGAFSKLLKSFIKDGYKDIYTFADLRYFTGGVYQNNGFKYVYTTKPNYFYFKTINNIRSRVCYQKHKLKDKLEHFDINKTEYQNMSDNGYNRIWDCGNHKYIYEG